MKGSICKCIFNFFYFFICSFCYNFLIERCDLVSTLGEAFAPVSVDCCSIKHALYCICVIYTPVHRCGCKCFIRSNGCHVDVISNARNTCCFTSCRSTCSICMLADQDTSVRDQCICTFFFEVKACPAVCVFNFHSYGWAYALSTKIERSISGNNLCIWECTNITHLAVIFCNCAVFDHLIQFETGNNTGYITSFINICKIVVHIGKSACCCLSSCCMAELYVRILSCCFKDIGLMTEAVCKNNLTSLICKVCCCIIASFVFTDQCFLNNL